MVLFMTSPEELIEDVIPIATDEEILLEQQLINDLLTGVTVEQDGWI